MDFPSFLLSHLHKLKTFFPRKRSQKSFSESTCSKFHLATTWLKFQQQNNNKKLSVDRFSSSTLERHSLRKVTSERRQSKEECIIIIIEFAILYKLTQEYTSLNSIRFISKKSCMEFMLLMGAESLLKFRRYKQYLEIDG